MLLQNQSEEEFHNCQDVFLSLAPQFLPGGKKTPHVSCTALQGLLLPLKKRKLDRGKLQEIITWRDTSN
jgi:hypothetical protein